MISSHKATRVITFVAMFLAAVVGFAGEDVEMLETGKPFVDFELEAHDGTTVRSADLQGRTFLLFFYPKAGTPG